jgi:anti-anti-sigma factor
MSALYQVAPNTFVLKLNAPLTIGQSQDVLHLFRYLSDQGVERVVVDLEDVLLVDSRGLVTLIAGYKIFGSYPQRFQLAAIQSQPQLVFELTGFDQVFSIVDSVVEAVPTIARTPIPLPWTSSTFARPTVMSLAA